MKFIYQDLLNFLEEQPSKEDLSKKLFQLGHEHEIDGDIFDMEITPNRGDCLSLIGLSRDLNNFYLNKEPYQIYDKDIKTLDLNFTNLSTKSCPKISFLEIEIEEKVLPYKPYLENYFLKLGNNKTNFFTDISNYVSYERGLPTHCFDKKFITQDLVFSNRPCKGSFKTLLGNEIVLEGKNCVFTIGDEIVSLAGVMGGESTACSSGTKNVLVECAYFNPEKIIGKTIKYNLKSDAAFKFERGVDLASQEKVLRRFISIVQDHTTIKNLSIKTFFGSESKEKYLPIETERVNKILGIKITNEEYISYLKNLGFEVGDKVKIPSFRHDINSQNDLSEEIARIIGYNNIDNIPLKLNTNLKQENNKVSMIEDFFIENGFSEVINFPFTEKNEKESILIKNPLDSKRKYMRTSLKDSLIQNLLYNERRQKDSLKIFEISDIYSKNPSISIEKKLGLIVSGRRGNNFNDFSKNLDYEYLDEILNQRHGELLFEIVEIPRVELNTKKKEKIFYAEIIINEIPDTFFEDTKLSRSQINFTKYSPISEFPSSTRDFSFSIRKPEIYNEVVNIIDNLNHENLKHSFIFDYFINHKSGEIKVGVRLIFQSTLKTLSDKEIQNAVNYILKPIIELDNVTIPGL